MNFKTYAWVVEDEVTSGTLDAYSKHWEYSHYTGDSVSDVLWDGTKFWKVNTEPVSVSSGVDSTPYEEYGNIVLVDESGNTGEQTGYTLNLDA